VLALTFGGISNAVSRHSGQTLGEQRSSASSGIGRGDFDATVKVTRVVDGDAIDISPSVEGRSRVRRDFDSLIGAMHLQMWWLMASAGDITRCEFCGRIVSLARARPEGRKHRRDKRFCDDACRQAHHRSKKKL
jgi:hypothetical protein